MEHHLDQELRAVESQLADLAPSTIPSDILERMELVMGEWGNPAELSQSTAEAHHLELNELELHLGQLSPASMPDDMLNRMSQAMDHWNEDFQAPDNLIPIGGEQRHSPPVWNRSAWAAAAAVAILGAVTALLIPRIEPSNTNVASAGGGADLTSNNQNFYSPPIVNSDLESNSPVMLVTSNALSHNVTGASDRGVILTDDDRAMRCIRVDYIDRIMGVDSDGREIEIKAPGIDYMLIPVETN